MIEKAEVIAEKKVEQLPQDTVNEAQTNGAYNIFYRFQKRGGDHIKKEKADRLTCRPTVVRDLEDVFKTITGSLLRKDLHDSHTKVFGRKNGHRLEFGNKALVLGKSEPLRYKRGE